MDNKVAVLTDKGHEFLDRYRDEHETYQNLWRVKKQLIPEMSHYYKEPNWYWKFHVLEMADMQPRTKSQLADAKRPKARMLGRHDQKRRDKNIELRKRVTNELVQKGYMKFVDFKDVGEVKEDIWPRWFGSVEDEELK